MNMKLKPPLVTMDRTGLTALPMPIKASVLGRDCVVIGVAVRPTGEDRVLVVWRDHGNLGWPLFNDVAVDLEAMEWAAPKPAAPRRRTKPVAAATMGGNGRRKAKP